MTCWDVAEPPRPSTAIVLLSACCTSGAHNPVPSASAVHASVVTRTPDRNDGKVQDGLGLHGVL